MSFPSRYQCSKVSPSLSGCTLVWCRFSLVDRAVRGVVSIGRRLPELPLVGLQVLVGRVRGGGQEVRRLLQLPRRRRRGRLPAVRRQRDVVPPGQVPLRQRRGLRRHDEKVRPPRRLQRRLRRRVLQCVHLLSLPALVTVFVALTSIILIVKAPFFR